MVACAAVRLAIEFLARAPGHSPAQMRRLATLNRLRWWESVLGAGDERINAACNMILDELDSNECFGVAEQQEDEDEHSC